MGVGTPETPTPGRPIARPYPEVDEGARSGVTAIKNTSSVLRIDNLHHSGVKTMTASSTTDLPVV